jgi:hypothetical protein
MATAPRPGASKRAEAAKAARRVLKIRVGDESRLIAPNNVPFPIAMRIRKACAGLPLSAFWNGEATVDEDSLKVLWWAARMVSGEHGLSLDTVLGEWPEDLTADDLEVAVVGENGEDIADVEEIGDNPES